MFKALNVSKSGLKAFQRKMDIVSNNISNVQTTGYKKAEVKFEDLVYDSLDDNGTPFSENISEDGILSGVGVKTKNMDRDYTQGILEKSYKGSHLAIKGEGFFGVTEKNSGKILLTRDGSFSVNTEGNLVDTNGNLVYVENQREKLNDNIKIKENGEIYSLVDGEKELVGEIPLFKVTDSDSLINENGNYFSVNDFSINESKITNNKSAIKQGYLEKSNVDIAKEMTDMLITQRAYQINTRSIRSADEMWNMINNIKR
ncbi:MAG: flagellar hook-basal body complex protein [Firmicutes bacterium]|nr:flagellar hook-basal body complex protein [Bacillota bacterium]